jgi:hypothetical protein
MGMDESAFLSFTPVPVRARRDGWTPERQRDFLALLAAHGCISRAARGVGKTKQTAYALRARPGAESFAAAWDEAWRQAAERKRASAPPSFTDRALGIVEPVFYRGRKVGERTRYDHRAFRILVARALASLEKEPGLPAGRENSAHGALKLGQFSSRGAGAPDAAARLPRTPPAGRKRR